jgi:hypothetical protein
MMHRLDVCLDSELAQKCLFQQVYKRKMTFTEAHKRMKAIRQNNQRKIKQEGTK